MKKQSQAVVIILCAVLGACLLVMDGAHRVYANGQQAELTYVDRLQAENAVLRANLNEAQRQIVDLTSKLLAVDRATLAASFHDTYHADIDWQTLNLKPAAVDTSAPLKESKK